MTVILEEIIREVEALEALEAERPEDTFLRRMVTRSMFAAAEALTAVMLDLAARGRSGFSSGCRYEERTTRDDAHLIRFPRQVGVYALRDEYGL